MQKRVTFADTDEGRELFVILWDGLVIGASKGEARAKDVIRKERTLLKKVMTISDPATDIDLRMRPPNARVLKSGPQELLFEASEIEFIESYIAKVPWSGTQSIAVGDFYDLLSLAPGVTD